MTEREFTIRSPAMLIYERSVTSAADVTFDESTAVVTFLRTKNVSADRVKSEQLKKSFFSGDRPQTKKPPDLRTVGILASSLFPAEASAIHRRSRAHTYRIAWVVQIPVGFVES